MTQRAPYPRYFAHARRYPTRPGTRDPRWRRRATDRTKRDHGRWGPARKRDPACCFGRSGRVSRTGHVTSCTVALIVALDFSRYVRHAGRVARIFRWLDARNQRLVDAQLGRVTPTGPGLTVVVGLLNGDVSLKYHVWLRVDAARRQPLPWGSVFVPVSPGEHQVEFAYWGPLPGLWRCVRRSTVVVPLTGTVRVEYRTGATRFSKAVLTIG
jgi:hypothetical protein